MRVIRSILILAALAVCTSATRADDLSELVAAVAGSMTVQNMKNDTKTATFGAGKPRYMPKPKQKDVDFSMLDGIYKAMKREQFYYMLSESSDSYSYEFERRLERQRSRPTLGRRDFFRPVPGQITSNFGWRPRFQRVHHGVDLSLHVGDTVRAAISGTVEKIAYDHDGYGHYVVMSHPDGMQTVYGHLEYALVSQGQFIYSGQPLGIGGNTGNSTGPHLHFEARVGDVAVDPTLLFDFYGNATYFAEEEEEIAPVKPKGPVYSHQSKSLARESTYIVRYGDTLESIARQAGISVMRLCQLNMLQQSSQPEIGRMLKLK